MEGFVGEGINAISNFDEFDTDTLSLVLNLLFGFFVGCIIGEKIMSRYFPVRSGYYEFHQPVFVILLGVGFSFLFTMHFYASIFFSILFLICCD